MLSKEYLRILEELKCSRKELENLFKTEEELKYILVLLMKKYRQINQLKNDVNCKEVDNDIKLAIEKFLVYREFRELYGEYEELIYKNKI